MTEENEKKDEPKSADDEDVAELTEGLKLTHKQRLFAWHYCIDLNATQAAISAGYSERSASSIGHEVLKKPEVSEAIERRMEEINKETKVSAGWVRKNLISTMCRARDEGQQGSVVNRSLELIGRNIGIFLDRQDVTTGGEPIAQVVIYPSNGREVEDDEDE